MSLELCLSQAGQTPRFSASTKVYAGASDQIFACSPARSENSYILVLYNGHKSHGSLPLIEWAKHNYIIFFVLPIDAI